MTFHSVPPLLSPALCVALNGNPGLTSDLCQRLLPLDLDVNKHLVVWAREWLGAMLGESFPCVVLAADTDMP